MASANEADAAGARLMIVFRSIDRPELALEEDDVALCDTCDADDATCHVCRGYGLVHGYDSHGLGLPVVVDSGTPPARAELPPRLPGRAPYGYHRRTADRPTDSGSKGLGSCGLGEAPQICAA